MSEKNLGMGVMFNMLFGGRSKKEVDALKACFGKTIKNVKIDPEVNGDGELHIDFTDGRRLVVYDDGRSCCESRYMTTDDDLSAFAGAALNDIELAEGPQSEGDWEVHEQQFVKVHTSNGTFTLVTHNLHNGYYGGFYLKTREEETPND